MLTYSIRDSNLSNSYDLIDNETGKILGIITASAVGFYNIGSFLKSKEAVKHIYITTSRRWQRGRSTSYKRSMSI